MYRKKYFWLVNCASSSSFKTRVLGRTIFWRNRTQQVPLNICDILEDVMNILTCSFKQFRSEIFNFTRKIENGYSQTKTILSGWIKRSQRAIEVTSAIFTTLNNWRRKVGSVFKSRMQKTMTVPKGRYQHPRLSRSFDGLVWPWEQNSPGQIIKFIAISWSTVEITFAIKYWRRSIRV